MMGVPEGWITDVGLSRNEELKACGNGVVPQQAELALRILLTGSAFAPSEYFATLPTPTAVQGRNATSGRKADSQHHHGVTLHDLVFDGTLPKAAGMAMFPTSTVSETFTDNLASSQQKPGSMHSVTLPQAVKWVAGE
jgi:hypothetical protein